MSYPSAGEEMRTQKPREINECIHEYMNAKSQQGQEKFDGILAALLEYWALELDYEIKSQLLNKLLLKYSAAMRKLVELNQLKSRFLGIAAHDLRNPLTSIRGLSEILLTDMAGPLNEDQREYLTIINTASDGMLALVNNLLDISIIESGNLDLKIGVHSLQAVLYERLRIFRNLAKDKNLQLVTNISELPPFRFDRNKIAQVVDNLLGNAIKFSPPDKNVTVSLERDSNMARVGIQDEGSGVPEEDRARIFGEFQKSRARPTGGEKSTGLGLAIAKRIVVAHRGNLEIRSAAGRGSLFTFTLPLEDFDDGNQETTGHDRG